MIAGSICARLTSCPCLQAQVGECDGGFRVGEQVNGAPLIEAPQRHWSSQLLSSWLLQGLRVMQALCILAAGGLFSLEFPHVSNDHF